jgi:hypothetical protein
VHRRVRDAFEQALGAGKPPADRREQGGVEQQVHGHAHGGSRGGQVITGLHARRVGAFPGVDGHIEMPGGVGDSSQQRQVWPGQRRGRIRFDEEIVCLGPITQLRGGAGAFQGSGLGAHGDHGCSPL